MERWGYFLVPIRKHNQTLAGESAYPNMTLKYDVIRTQASIIYNRRGFAHRIGGPAIITDRGDRYWDQYGKLHRMDGPAIITRSDQKSYWVYGKKYTHVEYVNLQKS